jgi:D-alanyl-D-alanine carboxypeptidase (penicillin-binding protein 5/6)
MKMRIFSILGFIVFILLSPARAEQAPESGFEIATQAPFAIIMDFETESVLYAKSADEIMAPASMAKLMTVAVIFQKLKHGELRLDDTFTVTERAWKLSVAGKNESSKMFVSIGSQIRVEDLLRGIIIQSGNDACTVVAEHISGSEEAFADLMNSEAKRLGLKNSVFKNANGLPHPDMHVTAHDLGTLAVHLIKEYPEYYHYFAEREFTWNGIKQGNRNLLLGTYAGADGLKTGHTADSGYGMVASALVDGRRLIVVVNGLKSDADRASETKRLLDLGFREFRQYILFKQNEVVGLSAVWAGEAESVSLVVTSTVKMLMRRSQRDGLKVTLSYDSPIASPVTKGQVVGKLKITVPGQSDTEVPVAAAEDVDAGGFMTQIKIGVNGLFSSQPEPQSLLQQIAPEQNPSNAVPVHE